VVVVLDSQQAVEELTSTLAAARPAVTYAVLPSVRVPNEFWLI
jgi:hypothetical protein